VNVDHLKVNTGNNVMRLFLYADYLTPCFRSDNIASVDLQGRQHQKKKKTLCMCG
jgi:hypothetical protein